MMLAFRLVFGLMLLASLGCFAAYGLSKRPVWRARGRLILKWTLIAAVGWFAVILLAHLAGS